MDFGASRIKAALYCLQTKAILRKAEAISPSTVNHSVYPAYQVPVHLYRQVFDSLVIQVDVHQQADVILTCFEMHGFSLGEYYYSWKDARADLSWSYKFYQETRMRLKPGMAFSTIKKLNIQNQKIGTLANTIIDNVEGNHISLVASQGLVQYATADLSDRILGYLNCETYPLVDSYLGSSIVDNRSYRIYGGLGDLQAASLGANLGSAADLVVNLGTGSQVAIMAQDVEGDLRPLSRTQWIKVITHIPSGRALNVIAELVEPNRFWDIWSNLSFDEVKLASDRQVDLNCFESSWKYKSKSKSGLIYLKESQTIKQFIASVAKSWLDQYSSAIEILDPTRQAKNVVISGGLAFRSLFAIDYFASIDKNREYNFVKTITGEETLDGLIKFAEKHNVY